MKTLPALALLTLLLASTAAEAKIVTREIPYKDGATALTGFLAYDDAIRHAPGILVVHEWWGYNDYVRMRAQQLAALGYVAFAADMYGTGKFGNNPKEAEALATPFYKDPHLMLTRAEAGLEVLKRQPQVDKDRVGAIGYCFGGSVVLEVARHGADDVRGVVSFHGGLKTSEPAEAGRVTAQVLALNGGADKMVTEKERNNFRKEMTDAGVTFKTVDYPGATHAFTNPKATQIGKRFDMPIEYNEQADKASWVEMQKFFKRIFSAPVPPKTLPTDRAAPVTKTP